MPNAPAQQAADEQETQKPRTTIEIDGTNIHLPEADTAIATELKSAIITFNTLRGYAAADEAKALIQAYSADGLRENQWQLANTLFAGSYPRERFDSRYDLRIKDIEKIAELWQQWSKGIADLYFWDKAGLQPFATSENSFQFPQIRYTDSGRGFSLHPPITTNGYGINSFSPTETEPQSLRLDLPLDYKPGTPVEDLTRYPRELLRNVTDLLAVTFRGPFAARITPWLQESLALAELESNVFAPTTHDGILPRAVARYMTALPNIDGDENDAKANAIRGALTRIPGNSPEAVDQLLTALEKVDPLQPPPADTTSAITENLRFVCQNLVTVALLDTALSGEQNTLFQRLQKADIAIPEGGFDHDAFLTALDKVIDKDEGPFSEKLARLHEDLTERLRTAIPTLKSASDDNVKKQ